ncbi:Carboxyl/cholinesterase 7 [Operophtera brumata]|uniref:Carboxylic ester hydrolase n=1 Tax=Operophtera brumata TaxID=104452 RepID=A0A0L7KYC7_OPEBR|nr:Carboxyl/cholinesterase 7 [Operophtera brumata]
MCLLGQHGRGIMGYYPVLPRFLSTGDDVIPGNNGLKDQSFALHWVRHNIMLFGGNPDSITLTGCSAGGASVHYHYLSPLGSAFASWTHAVKPAQKAKALAAIVGCPTGTSKEILDCLKFRPGEVIVNAQIEMDPFLTHYPYHAARMGAMHDLPLITSVTSEEGLYPAAAYQAEPGLIPELEAHWQQLASNIFEYNDTLPQEQRAAVAIKIKERYLGSQPIILERRFPTFNLREIKGTYGEILE